MDLDLLLFGNQNLETVELTLPHPRMMQRRFVLVPLLDIAPALADPLSGASLKTLLSGLSSDQQVRKLE